MKIFVGQFLKNTQI